MGSLPSATLHAGLTPGAEVYMPSEAVRVPFLVCWLLWRPGPSWYPLAAALTIVAVPASIGTYGIVGLNSIISTSPFS